MRCLWLILLWALSGALALGARVAVVDQTNSPDRAALLTLALGKIDGLEVLERAQMNQLVGELQLQTLAGAGKFSALGKLLNADGLVIVDNIPLGAGQTQLTVRLIAVATGACVMIRDLPQTANTDADAATWIAHSVGESTSALTQKIEGLIPVALVSIRSELSTKASGDLDRALKLLLEKKLGNTPGILLLERRRLGDVNFDKALDASDAQPLLKGAILLEGTLASPAADGQFSGRMSMSRADGSLAQQAEFTGATNALPAVVEQLAAQIVAAAGLPKTTSAPANFQEGRRFYLEARLAWRAADRVSAEEALSAARVLGDSGPEVPWLTLLMEEARLNAETTGLDWPFLSTVRQARRPNTALTADWNELRATVDETLADLAAFRQSFFASEHESALKIDLKVDSWDTDYYLFSQHILRFTALFLWQRDERGDQAAEPIRQQMRQLAEEVKWPGPWSPVGFDVLRGVPVAAWTLPVPLLAQNSDELLSWYEKIFRWNKPSDWATNIARDDATALGPRFRNQPAVVDAWHGLLQRLADDPATSLRVRLYQTGALTTPAQQEAYLELLEEIGRRAVELQDSGELPILLTWNSVRLGARPPNTATLGGRTVRASRLLWALIADGRIKFVTTLFNTLPKFEENIFTVMAGSALPNVPDDLVAPLQEAFLAYRARCLAEPLDHPQLTRRKAVFADWQKQLIRANPKFDFSAIQADEDGLTVDRFWQPAASVDYPFQFVVGNDGNVWLSGREGADNVIYQIALPGLQPLHKEVKFGAYQIALTSSGTIWGVRSDANSPNSVYKVQGIVWVGTGISQRILMGTPQTDLLRWDPATGAGLVWEVPRQYDVFTVDDRVLVTFAYPHLTWATPQDALFEVNPGDGSLRLLASTERRPQQNPLDGNGFQTIAIAPGPGGAPVIAYNLDENTSLIRQLEGKWALLQRNKFRLADSIRAGNQTVLVGSEGNLVLLDPALDNPQMLLTRQPNGAVTLANGWSWPADWSGTDFAYRAGELFSLAQDDLRWWYPGGPADGVLIHLKITPHTQPPAAPRVTGRGNPAPADAGARSGRGGAAETAPAGQSRFDPPLIGNDTVLPGHSNGYVIIATPSGLIVTDKITGLWFIPNEDLDAYRETSAVDDAGEDPAAFEP